MREYVQGMDTEAFYIRDGYGDIVCSIFLNIEDIHVNLNKTLYAKEPKHDEADDRDGYVGGRFIYKNPVVKYGPGDEIVVTRADGSEQHVLIIYLPGMNKEFLIVNTTDGRHWLGKCKWDNDDVPAWVSAATLDGIFGGLKWRRIRKGDP